MGPADAAVVEPAFPCGLPVLTAPPEDDLDSEVAEAALLEGVVLFEALTLPRQ